MSLFKIALAIQDHPQICEFEGYFYFFFLNFCEKLLLGYWSELHWILHISLGPMDVSILIFPIHKHGMPFHLSMSSIIPFRWFKLFSIFIWLPLFLIYFYFFLSYNCVWHSLLNFFFRYFIDCDWYFWNVTDIFMWTFYYAKFLISFSHSSLIVTDIFEMWLIFFMWTFHCETLLNLFISSIFFFLRALGYCTYMIISSVNKEQFYFFLSDLVAFYYCFSCLIAQMDFQYYFK